MIGSLKELLIGQPLSTEQQHHQRLSKRIALAVFSSDALSSVAYASEAIMLAARTILSTAAKKSRIKTSPRIQFTCEGLDASGRRRDQPGRASGLEAPRKMADVKGRRGESLRGAPLETSVDRGAPSSRSPS